MKITKRYDNQEIDSPRDVEYFKQVEKLKRDILTPLVGDFVRLEEGIKRISTFHRDGTFQVSDDGSCHLYSDGECDFSGGFFLNAKQPLITSKLHLVGTYTGRCWRFKDGEVKVHNGVYTEIEFNLFELN